jgi:hypothetical protein
MNIVNLTPHKINIFDENGNEIAVIEPSGTIAKIGMTRERSGFLAGIPTFKTVLGDPEGLPPKLDGVIYIVSGMFRSHVQRPDLYQPGELLRDDEGRPIGCIGLSQ